MPMLQKLITNDYDENDKPFLTGERSPEGFHYVKHGIDQAISRGLAYAPYCDLIWCETATPNLEEAKKLITEDGKKPPSLDVFLEYVGLTEKEFNEIITNQVIPPNQPNFERNEFAKKTHDFNDWYREDNRKNDSDN